MRAAHGQHRWPRRARLQSSAAGQGACLRQPSSRFLAFQRALRYFCSLCSQDVHPSRDYGSKVSVCLSSALCPPLSLVMHLHAGCPSQRPGYNGGGVNWSPCEVPLGEAELHNCRQRDEGGAQLCFIFWLSATLGSLEGEMPAHYRHGYQPTH